MTSSSLNGKPDDYESRKQWTVRDWYTHLGAWENDKGQLCFGSSIAFSILLDQFQRTWVTRTTQELAAPDLLEALENLLCHSEYLEELIESERGRGRSAEALYEAGEMDYRMIAAKKAIARARGVA